MSVCDKTTRSDYPHHWECIQTDGHKGCNCSDLSNLNYCQAFECLLEDNSRRFPDGSIVARDHLRAGNIAVGVHSLSDHSVKVIKY